MRIVNQMLQSDELDALLCLHFQQPAEGEERGFDIVWVRERPCSIMLTIVASLASDAI